MRRTASALLLVAALGARADAQRGVLTARIAGYRAAAASDTVALRIVTRMTPGWHVGAEKPGKAGVPTKVAWRLPTGWRVLSTRWTPPTPAVVGRDTVLEYRGPFAIETTILTRGARRSGEVQALLTYGICKDVCIPGRLALKYYVR